MLSLIRQKPCRQHKDLDISVVSNLKVEFKYSSIQIFSSSIQVFNYSPVGPCLRSKVSPRAHPHPRSKITLYKTLFLNNLRFSADNFTTIQRSNDACVLYESRKNQYSIGFILCSVHLVDKNEIYLLMNKVNITQGILKLETFDQEQICYK